MRATQMGLGLGLVALLWAGILSVSVAAEPTKQERAASQSNLKQIGIGFHNYADLHDLKWAEDITDKDGHVLLSWRVTILPALKQEKLYKQFRLNEAWDSEHNKKLIAKMPKVYAPVRVKAKPGETFYQRFVGKDALFTERGSPFTIPSVADGTSNTALVVEAGDPVIWTRPADLAFDAKAPLPKLGGLFDGEFHILFCDGSVFRATKNFDVNVMKKVITPNDGHVLDLKKLQK